MRLSYETYRVVYRHGTESSDTTRVNEATITTYGASELNLRAELARLRPDHRDIVVLEIAPTRPRT